VIEKYQSIGLPTGDLPDGSPNLMIQAMRAQLEGSNLEQLQNGKTETAFITPAGVITLPGKSL
jgi:hypothetical protein